jgi:hypothetical protein
VRLEHLFAALDDVVQQLAAFVENSRTEVVLVFLDTDCDPEDWPAMPGDCWQRVHRMFEPLLERLVPFEERFHQIGDITGRGHNLCVVCGKLREAYGDVYWSPSVEAGSWRETYCSRFAHHASNT